VHLLPTRGRAEAAIHKLLDEKLRAKKFATGNDEFDGLAVNVSKPKHHEQVFPLLLAREGNYPNSVADSAPSAAFAEVEPVPIEVEFSIVF
jgi:hypothetical protein